MLKYHIQTIEVGSGGASAVTFSSIPAIYTDLMIVCSARSTVDQRSIYLRPNGSTSNFSARYLQGNGSALNNFTGTSIQALASSSTETANTFSNSGFYISNYLSNTAKAISVDTVIENNATQAFQRIAAGLWSSTEAITSIQLATDSGDFVQYSSFSLYGIKRGSDGKTEVASGGTITTSGGYTIHTFNSSGTFVANRDINVDYLVVAGGGGGGSGGGGAGGLRSTITATGGGGSVESSLFLSKGTQLSVTVGAGGSAGNQDTARGGNGSISSFGPIVSTGGGGGGAGFDASAHPGAVGGSGGGGAYNRTSTGGSAVSNQGYSGGGATAAVTGGGGGGGANSVGANGTSSFNGGPGGNGISTIISGSSVSYSGGGGGASFSGNPPAGTGGTGGGGTGSGSIPPTAGVSNTGGGGGGGVNAYSGAAGGSGVVIIRYLTPAS